MWTSKSAGGALTSDLPTFSLSPQEYITKVGLKVLTFTPPDSIFHPLQDRDFSAKYS